LRRLIDILVAYAIIGGLIALAVRLKGEPPPDLAGHALAVDGDTLYLAGERLRLVGIDAPELEQSCDRDGRAMACGREAREALKAMLAKPITCRGLGRDVYGRRLVRCSTDDGELAPRLVAAGEALAEGCCRAEEAQARTARRGIWAGSFERPDAWRRRHPHPDWPS
jgi:endonuclease YncB( thermonuclease family)